MTTSDSSGSCDSLIDILTNLDDCEEVNDPEDIAKSEITNISVIKSSSDERITVSRSNSFVNNSDNSDKIEASNQLGVNENKIAKELQDNSDDKIVPVETCVNVNNNNNIDEESCAKSPDIFVDTSAKNTYDYDTSDNECVVTETRNLKITTASGSNVKSGDGDIIDQFLDKSQAEAEARLAARRAARAEAREIRMREVERQQREQEENADRQFDMLTEQPLLAATTARVRTGATSGVGGGGGLGVSSLTTTSAAVTASAVSASPASRYHSLSSRRSSEDSLEDTGNVRDLRHELKDVEEKFRKAMIANAQLDNDKASQTYQLELLKDRLEELEEEHSQLKREHRDKCRDHDQLARLNTGLTEQLRCATAELTDRDRLIAEKGLVIVGDDNGGGAVEDMADSGMTNGMSGVKRALVSAENAHLLENAGEGSLDVRLARFAKDRGELQDTISHLRLELEEERSRRRKNSGLLNGPSSDSDYDAADSQRVASKQLDDFKFRAQKAEQDVATLQANVTRLESQVIRYKSSAEASEKSEEALKTEKRKLQREAREAQSRAEELETANTHLIKRLDKLKTAKSALLKEL